MMSGKFAGETVIEAFKENDFTKRTLSLYKKKLDKSFVMTDMKSYKDLMTIVHNNSSSFLDFYLRKINKFFKMFIEVDSIAKKNKFRRFIFTTIKERGVIGLIKDIIHILKLVLGILK